MSGRRANVISLAERIVEEVQNFLSTREMHEETFRWTDLVEDVAEALSDDFDERLAGLPAPLAYSSELPRVAGRYWMQCKAAPQYETVWNVTEADVANPPSWFRLNRFAGPLERPMEAKSSTSAASFAADQGGR